MTIKKIAVLCSGGDAPGMNCAIRSVVRTGIGDGLEVYGVQKGYAGLLEGEFKKMTLSSVGNILQRGGTILQTSRCPEFKKKEVRKEAANLLKRKGIDALIVIGGDGSFNGAIKLSEENDIPIMGIPGTIDNDISGTKYSIGFDTAIQTAVEAVDKIRDTAHSHERTFIVEVMGRRSSSIAIHVGLCTGAENIVLPNQDLNIKQIVSDIDRGRQRGKSSSIIIVAEGEKPGLSYAIKEKLKEDHQIDGRVCILGHTQRGGSPSALDRFLASKMGFEAARGLTNGQTQMVAGFREGKVQLIPFKECLQKVNDYELPHLEVVKALSI